MRHRDLFSGIGGFSLAALWTWGKDHEIVSFCEKNKFCQKVLKKHWPDVSCIDDIFDLKGGKDGTIDLITAGFPCQPFSHAGKQAGKKDDRYLWPETLRMVQEDKPRWFIGENVPGIINMALDTVLSDLESEGYETETFIIPACAIGAPHRRERIWIIAHTYSQRQQEQRKPIPDEKTFSCTKLHSQIRTDANKQYGNNRRLRTSEVSQFQTSGIPIGQQWRIESRVGRMVNGISNRVDRLRSLGNTIVPQVAVILMQAMKEIDEIK